MRITFQAKLFLVLVLTVAVLLGGALLAVERAYAGKVDELIRTQVRQGRAQFRQLREQLEEDLVRDGIKLSSSSQIRSCLEEESNWPKAAGVALYEIELNAVEADLLVIASPEGTPISRLAFKPGAVHERGKKPPFENLPARAGAEAALVRRLLDGEDPDRLREFVVEDRRLFLAAAFPIFDGDLFRGVLVLGREIHDRLARRLHVLQADDDHVGFIVEGRILASSLPGADALVRDGDEYRAELDGHPYHVVQTPLSPQARTALFLSLRSLLDFRHRTRRTVLFLSLAAIALSLILSIAFSRGISAPVRDLVGGTQRIARGEYAHRIVVRSRDELGDLATAFNRMAGDLANQEKVRGVLQKVVSPDVAQELLQGDLGLGGRLMRAALLFADLRGFTKLTQNMPPQEVVALLNEFMTEMSAEIFACKGIVDKYVGDEIIGVFGAPKSYGHDSLAAIEAAHRMRLRLAALNGARARRGEPPLAMGIGIHTGEVVAGCMGSQQLMSYTCIGAAMNLAARLCSAAQPGQILVSEATLREAGGEVEARPLPPVQVKGFTDPVPIYEIASVIVGETDRRRNPLTGPEKNV